MVADARVPAYRIEVFHNATDNPYEVRISFVGFEVKYAAAPSVDPTRIHWYGLEILIPIDDWVPRIFRHRARPETTV